MTITIGRTTFDRVSFDADADVLYLHVGEPATAVTFDESPEGYALRFDADGTLVGLTFVNARDMLRSGQQIAITLPERVVIDPAILAPALDAT